MPDIMIRHIDRLMAERIKLLAKERQWSINDVVLQALRHGLGVSESSALLAENLIESRDLTEAGGNWDAREQAAFQEAMQALALARSEQLAPTNRNVGELLD
jgi:polyhydroxyalkanoate synthesis regulator phasin